MSKLQPGILQNIKIIITVISQSFLVLILISKLGIFYKILRDYNTHLLNYQENAVIKMSKYTSTCQNFLIKNTLILVYSVRCYLKLRGLGFSIKYVIKPQHILLLNIGCSKVRQIKVPENIAIIKKPRKKKIYFYNG